MKALFILFISASTLLVSCTKNKEGSESTITGKWKLIQTYNGYVMGGDFIWKDVPPNENHSIEFYESGNFTQIISPTDSCLGAYHLISNSKIEMSFECYPTPITYTIVSLNFEFLILSYPTIEGAVDYKYLRQ